MTQVRCLFLSMLLAVGFAGPASAADTPVVLTVVGEISETNRGPLDPMEDRLLDALGAEFEAAYAFDLAMLGALERASATMRGYDWPVARTLEGPLLDAVLSGVGATPDATLVLVALDGYAVELTAEDRANDTWILATHEAGVPLAIGGTGPLWLVPDRGPAPVAEGGSAQWIWGVYLVTVE